MNAGLFHALNGKEESVDTSNVTIGWCDCHASGMEDREETAVERLTTRELRENKGARRRRRSKGIFLSIVFHRKREREREDTRRGSGTLKRSV